METEGYVQDLRSVVEYLAVILTVHYVRAVKLVSDGCKAITVCLEIAVFYIVLKDRIVTESGVGNESCTVYPRNVEACNSRACSGIEGICCKSFIELALEYFNSLCERLLCGAEDNYVVAVYANTVLSVAERIYHGFDLGRAQYVSYVDLVHITADRIRVLFEELTACYTCNRLRKGLGDFRCFLRINNSYGCRIVIDRLEDRSRRSGSNGSIDICVDIGDITLYRRSDIINDNDLVCVLLQSKVISSTLGGCRKAVCIYRLLAVVPSKRHRANV